MSVEELIQAFEHSNKKADDIRSLSNRFNITEREVIDTLNKFNIKTPRIIGRGEAIDFSDNEIKKMKNKIELDDSDVTPAISIIKKFGEMGWNKKEGIERTIQLSYYIETKLGLDCFKIYCSMLEFIIQKSGVRGLEQDIDSIQNGKGFNRTSEGRLTEKVLEAFSQVAEGIVDNLVDDLADEPEAKPEKVINEKPLLVRFYEMYNMLTNPEQYRINKLREKEAKKKEFLDRGIEMLRGVFNNE